MHVHRAVKIGHRRSHWFRKGKEARQCLPNPSSLAKPHQLRRYRFIVDHINCEGTVHRWSNRIKYGVYFNASLNAIKQRFLSFVNKYFELSKNSNVSPSLAYAHRPGDSIESGLGAAVGIEAALGCVLLYRSWRRDAILMSLNLGFRTIFLSQWSTTWTKFRDPEVELRWNNTVVGNPVW